MSAWALGTLRYTPAGCALLTPLAAAACEPLRLGRTTPQGLANLVWGLSQVLPPEQLPPGFWPPILARLGELLPALAQQPKVRL